MVDLGAGYAALVLFWRRPEGEGIRLLVADVYPYAGVST